jgi:hypothetical protein
MEDKGTTAFQRMANIRLAGQEERIGLRVKEETYLKPVPTKITVGSDAVGYSNPDY